MHACMVPCDWPWSSVTVSNVLMLQTNVRHQLSRMEKEVDDLKQRVQLTKLDLAHEQQVTS